MSSYAFIKLKLQNYLVADNLSYLFTYISHVITNIISMNTLI